MKNKPKTKYSAAKCIFFILKADRESKSHALEKILLLIAAQVGLHLTQLYVAPAILGKVESAAPVGELLMTIGIFAGLLFAFRCLHNYLDKLKNAPIITIRCHVRNLYIQKWLTTSYPNTNDPELIRLYEASADATNGNADATEEIWRELIGLMTNLICFCFYLVLLTNLSLPLIVLVFVTSAIGYRFALWCNDFHYRHRKEEHTYSAQLDYLNKKFESVAVAKDIRIFGLGTWLSELFANILRGYQDFQKQVQTVALWGKLLDVVLTLLRNGLAYAYLIRLTLTEGLSAAEFLLYFGAISGFCTWIDGIIDHLRQTRKRAWEISPLMEMLAYPEPFRFSGGVPVPRADSYELRLENVTFTYPGAEKPLFRNLSLTVHPGEKLAIVGLNGAGKTTLVKLLCGFQDPDSGRVLLNGQDIREFNRREYYDLISAVYQNFSVLDATVAENVAQQMEEIDCPRVEECLEKAGLLSFVRELPKGLETVVGREVWLDGVQLSGGQIQRLMLARALYKGSPILVLDEPTAALDPIAEDDIYRKYNDMAGAKTSLFISHRLASTRFCDRILFLADGTVTEEGTHASLLAMQGQYAALFEVQSRYYQEGRDFRGE